MAFAGEKPGCFMSMFRREATRFFLMYSSGVFLRKFVPEQVRGRLSLRVFPAGREPDASCAVMGGWPGFVPAAGVCALPVRLVAHRSPSALLQRAEDVQRMPKARARVMPGSGVRRCSADHACSRPGPGGRRRRGRKRAVRFCPHSSSQACSGEEGFLPWPESRAFCWRKVSAFRPVFLSPSFGRKGCA